MRYLICYDVTENKARARLVRVLEGQAYRVQKSVFEGFFSAEEIDKLKSHCRKLIDEKTDTLRFYPLCERCEGRMEGFGQMVRVHCPDYEII